MSSKGESIHKAKSTITYGAVTGSLVLCSYNGSSVNVAQQTWPGLSSNLQNSQVLPQAYSGLSSLFQGLSPGLPPLICSTSPTNFLLNEVKNFAFKNLLFLIPFHPSLPSYPPASVESTISSSVSDCSRFPDQLWTICIFLKANQPTSVFCKLYSEDGGVPADIYR